MFNLINKSLYYVGMDTYNKTNEKSPRIPIINFYILIKFNIQGKFCASLSVRISDSGQPVNCARKYCTKRNCPNINTYKQAQFKNYCTHHTLLHTHAIQHTKKILHQPIRCTRNYCTKQNCHIVHNYTHTRFTRHITHLHTTTFPHQSE